MRMADPSPLGETSFRAIVRAICDADPANVCGGGCVESVLTALTQRRFARFFAMDIWTLVLLLHQAKCDPSRDHAQGGSGDVCGPREGSRGVSGAVKRSDSSETALLALGIQSPRDTVGSQAFLELSRESRRARWRQTRIR